MKTVWILGAGASIGHTKGQFPTINQFFSKAKELGITVDEDNNLADLFSSIQSYIKNIFGKDIIEENTEIDIEKVMTYIDIDNEKLNNAEINTLRQDLLEFIRIVLYKLSIEFSSDESEYNYMVKKLDKNDSIISFNWDLLFDNTLGRKNILPDSNEDSIEKDNYQQYYNTVLDLSAHGENTWKHIGVHQPYNIYYKNKGYYLKLHGSIDWLYCSNKTCKGYGKVFPMLHYNVIHYCSVCHEKMEYLIIPPVLNKQYDIYPYIRTVWNKATKELQNAEKIIIWGYSLPPTDFYSNWLLRQARSSIKELVIINPDAKLGSLQLIDWNRKFINKFIDLYKPKITFSSMNVYENFKDFYEENNLRSKYNLKDY